MVEFNGNAKALKREHPATDVDRSVRCKECNKPIKTRLVKMKEVTPKLCYKHWKEATKNG